MKVQKLKSLNRWLLYRMEPRGNRMTKIPVNPKTGSPADVTNSDHWTDYATAAAALNNYHANGVGIVFDGEPVEGKLHLTGIDIDHCVDAVARTATPIVYEIGNQLNSYTEMSPSGTGLHILLLSDVSANHKNGAHGLEVYSSKRFFTFTGSRLPSRNPEICDCTEPLKAIITKYFPVQEKDAIPLPRVLSNNSTTNDDEKILSKMFGSRNGEKLKNLFYGDMSDYHDDHSSADLALARHLAYWTNGDLSRMDRLFRKSGLMRQKWDSHRNDSTYGMLTLKKALA